MHTGFLVCHHSKAGIDAEGGGVVIQGVILLGPVIHHFVAFGREVADQVGTKFHAGVVRGDVDAGCSHRKSILSGARVRHMAGRGVEGCAT